MIVGILVPWGVSVFDSRCIAASGTEGASFLDIPVGAGPAALGGSYTARASDVYASVWNPAGLGFLDSTQVAGQHLSYLGTTHYEYAGAAYPLSPGHSIEASLQYLGSGDILGTDAAGNSTSDFSAYYASYNLAYGQSFGSQLALGATAKWINAKLSDVSANAFAADFGAIYKPMDKLSLGVTLTNVGNDLTFLNEGDSLPLATHIGAVYQTDMKVNMSAEVVYQQTGLASLCTGLEWMPIPALTWRLGYRTDTLAGLSPLAGFSTGIGLVFEGQEFSYAWVPLGELGNTQYFSLVLRFGAGTAIKRNLIQYEPVKKQRTPGSVPAEKQPEYEQLMNLLSDEPKPAQQPVKSPEH